MLNKKTMKTTRTIQIRFVEGEDNESARNFLESLELNADECHQYQIYELPDGGKGKIFGISVSLDDEEFASTDLWDCSVIERDGSRRFLINDVLIAARISGDVDLKETLGHLPQDIKLLCLAELPISDLESISDLRTLNSLALFKCESLKDITALSGLTSLTSLTSLSLIACCITDFTTLAIQETHASRVHPALP